MIGLLQRVSEASVLVEGETVGEISMGLLVLLGVQHGDTTENADRLINKMLAYRIFEDSDGKMNLGLNDVAGGLLLVPQFTLAADTRKGLRPGFSSAASPEIGEELFNYCTKTAEKRVDSFACGRFGANMQVHLVNNGPATFWLEV